MKAIDIKDKEIRQSKLHIHPEMKNLMHEIDVNVKRLVDEVRFILKYRVIFRGRGMEFEGLREYTPSDDASMIDWKISRRVSTSKKIDNLYVRVYEEERDLNIFVLLDTSETMIFGTQDKLKTEYASVIAGSLIYTAIEVGDKAGIGMFSDRIHKNILPSKASDQYYRILRELSNQKNYGGGCDLYSSLKTATSSLDSRSILFIVSDFINVGDKWEDLLKAASSKFEGVLGIMVRDISVTDVNLDRIREKYRLEAEKQEKNIGRIFKDAHAGFIKCYTNEPFVNPLVKWFSMWGAGR